MDGNRRWARERGLPTLEGHRKGAAKLKEVLDWSDEQGIRFVTVYAFSTENWKRDKTEVEGLLSLVREYLDTGLKDIGKKATVRFIGQRERFGSDIQNRMEKLEQESYKADALTVAIALSYGGRDEIVQGVNRALAQGGAVTEDTLSQHLFTTGMPDPDLILRTGGQHRLSNFLTWQSVYTELLFSDTLWPALSREEFDTHIEEYRARIRNFGV